MSSKKLMWVLSLIALLCGAASLFLKDPALAAASFGLATFCQVAAHAA